MGSQTKSLIVRTKSDAPASDLNPSAEIESTLTGAGKTRRLTLMPGVDRYSPVEVAPTKKTFPFEDPRSLENCLSGNIMPKHVLCLISVIRVTSNKNLMSELPHLLPGQETTGVETTSECASRT